MKKFDLKFEIFSAAFVFGIIVTFLWFRYFPPLESLERTNLAQIPTVKYCELESNPRSYDGKIIRVKTNLYFFTHGYFLADNNCLGKGDERRTAVGFYEPKRELLWKKTEQFQQEIKWFEPVEIVAVGRFTYKNLLGGSDGIEDRTHLQFEIYDIEYAGK